MPEEKAPVAQGEVVAGKYRVDRVLGSGGMGIVVAATQLELDRPVAIKFLVAEAAKAPEIVARFGREARAVAKIQGEHVARVLDVGVLENGLPYMVMEYLDGADLAQRIAREGRLPLPEMARYVLEACEALAEAHAAGIIHRDLKPANLFLARRPDRTTIVKLLDFGISKSPVGAAGGITSTQAIMGSPVYMSPEQLVSAKHVDARSDIWSLGVVLHEALAGTPPFNAESMPQIVTRILHTSAPPLSDSRPELPPAVGAIVERCLAKDPAARFGDVAELASALAPFVEDGARSVERIARVLGRNEAPPPQAALLAPSIRPGADAWGGTQAQLPRRSAGPWIVAAVIGACAVLGIAAVVVRTVRRREPTTPVAAIVVPSVSVALQDPPPVKLAPPADPPAESASSAASAPTAVVVPHAKPTGAHAGRPTAVSLAASTPTTAAPTPTPTPTPTPEPADPLHMGIK
ncbi:MAG TPA: serine/threonine-protein kinase [Polyangiaceae bacterium]|jgi:serine/threonine-protein kinase